MSDNLFFDIENKSHFLTLSIDLIIEIISFIFDEKIICTLQLTCKIFNSKELYNHILLTLFNPFFSIKFEMNRTEDDFNLLNDDASLIKKSIISSADLTKLLIRNYKRNEILSERLRKSFIFEGKQQIINIFDAIFKLGNNVDENTSTIFNLCPCCNFRISYNHVFKQDVGEQDEEQNGEDFYLLNDCSNGLHEANIKCSNCNYALNIQLVIFKKCALQCSSYEVNNEYKFMDGHKTEEFEVCDGCNLDVCSNCADTFCAHCYMILCKKCSIRCEICQEYYCEEYIEFTEKEFKVIIEGDEFININKCCIDCAEELEIQFTHCDCCEENIAELPDEFNIIMHDPEIEVIVNGETKSIRFSCGPCRTKYNFECGYCDICDNFITLDKMLLSINKQIMLKDDTKININCCCISCSDKNNVIWYFCNCCEEIFVESSDDEYGFFINEPAMKVKFDDVTKSIIDSDK